MVNKMIKLKSVDKKYKNVKVLNSISLEINRSEIIAIIGFSGSGKTTLAKIITSIEKIDCGEINVNGKAVYISQEYNQAFNHKMNVLEILSEAYKIFDKKIDFKEILEILKLVKLDELILNLNISKLSGGEKQRINIARAILLKADILVFDEAISSLDILLQFEIIDIIKRINNKYGTTILFITHNIEIIKFLTSKILKLDNGKINISHLKRDKLY